MNLTVFKPEAPNMIGIATRKENSAATFLSQPISIAAKIVIPLLEVPGIKARICAQPIIKAVLIDITQMALVLNS